VHMTNEPVGFLRKLWNPLTAWLRAMDYSAFDYANERIVGLERDVERLKNELRRARMSAGTAGALEPVREPAKPE
jgi:hypothetical protein